MKDLPIDLDKHRGMAAQKATDLRRILADVEANAVELRERQRELEEQLLALPAETWSDAAAKARYILNLYLKLLSPQDSQHRALVDAVLADFARLGAEA
jgi:hypothetical protein